MFGSFLLCFKIKKITAAAEITTKNPTMLTAITTLFKEFVDGESGAILLLIGDAPELDGSVGEDTDEDVGEDTDEVTGCLVWKFVIHV